MKKIDFYVDEHTAANGAKLLFSLLSMLNSEEYKKEYEELQGDISDVMESFMYVKLDVAYKIAKRYCKIHYIKPKRIKEYEYWEKHLKVSDEDAKVEDANLI